MKTKTRVSLVLGLFLAVILLSACGSGSKQANTETDAVQEHEQMAKKVVYTCTMHPDVEQSEPGACPKCNMALVKKSDLETSDDSSEEEESHEGHNHEGHEGHSH